jgi:hypothetical protein
MTRLKALALAALLSAAGPCFAADPAGDWIGTLHANHGAQTRLGLEVRPSAGGYAATYEDMTHDYRGLPMTPTRTGAAPGFQIKSRAGVFSADWDGAAGQWKGVWREASGAYPMALTRGPIPPAPAVATRDKWAIGVFAGLAALEAAGIARLLQLRRRRRSKAR